VPVLVTGCAVARLLQNGVPAYEMVAVGKTVMVKGFVETALPQGKEPVEVNVRVTLPAAISVALGV
jgi:hypothetical protein